MLDFLWNSAVTFVPVYIAAWHSGFFFENFGKGSMMENYLETYFKV